MKINLSKQQANITLVALLTIAVLGISLATYLQLTANQNVFITRSQYWNLEIPVAEAGVEEALAQLYHNPGNLGANNWTLTNGYYTKTRAVDSNCFYVVRIQTNTNPIILSSGYVRQPMSTNYLSARTVQANTWRTGLFFKGMVAKGMVDLTGNNIMSDSFDSTDPLYSVAGHYNQAVHKDNGDIYTNSHVTNSLNVGNANIFGRVGTGPGGTVAVGSNGKVGDSTYQVTGANGTIQPGRSTDDMNVSFQDVTVPFTGGASIPTAGSVGGTNYTYLISGGNNQLPSLTMSGQEAMMVTNNAVLYVTGDVSLSGNAQIIIAPGKTLQLFVGGANASIGGNGIANSENATNFFYWGLPSNTSLSFSGNSAFIGAIYAPNAAFTLGGGGNNNYDFVGASVSGTVRLNGHYNFHYDENLGKSGPRRSYIVTNWVEL
jgi:hypothetical protein